MCTKYRILVLCNITSLTAFAETNNSTVTANKIEGNVLDKDGNGKISQFFDGNYLIIKQSTFAIVWTVGEVSKIIDSGEYVCRIR